MKLKTLALCTLALASSGGGVYLLFEIGMSEPARGALGREPLSKTEEVSAADLAVPRPTDAALTLDVMPSEDGDEQPKREEAGEPGEPRERDDLFADSPTPPEPGEYDGNLAEEFYDDGMRLFEAQQTQREDGVWVVDGRWNSWHENGQMQESGFYANEKETGDWIWWDDNGQQIAGGTFVDGEREGQWTYWYSDGTKQMDARYSGGKGAGNWNLFYEDGSPWVEGQYVNGEISGYWTIWDEFGEVNPERTGVYEHGVRVSD